MPDNLTTILSSASKTVSIHRDRPVTIIGERINPTGRQAVLNALKAGDFSIVRQDAISQVAAGAHVLDINAGVPGADESTLIQQIMRIVMEEVDVPLCIDSNNPEAIKAALEVYNGKALVNSVNGEKQKLAEVLPLVRDHHAAVICLCMDDDGIPPTPDDRLRVADRIITQATGMGIPIEDLVLDPLAMTMGTDSQSGRITLETTAMLVKEYGVNVTMGASNISFGLPDRKYINATFLAMAIHAGLTCPITNPLVEEIQLAALAANLAMGRDEYSMAWIKAYRAREKAKKNA